MSDETHESEEIEASEEEDVRTIRPDDIIPITGQQWIDLFTRVRKLSIEDGEELQAMIKALLVTKTNGELEQCLVD